MFQTERVRSAWGGGGRRMELGHGWEQLDNGRLRLVRSRRNTELCSSSIVVVVGRRGRRGRSSSSSGAGASSSPDATDSRRRRRRRRPSESDCVFARAFEGVREMGRVQAHAGAVVSRRRGAEWLGWSGGSRLPVAKLRGCPSSAAQFER